MYLYVNFEPLWNSLADLTLRNNCLQITNYKSTPSTKSHFILLEHGQIKT